MKKALLGDLMSHLPLVRKTIILGPTFAAAVISDRTGMEVSADVVKKVCKKMAIQIPDNAACMARVTDHLIATFEA